MHQLISQQQTRSIGQIVFPQPDILYGIIPSLFDLVESSASSLLVGHNPANLIILVFTYNNNIRGPLLCPTR